MSSLATHLRQGTQDARNAAENTAFMRCCASGIVEREPFRKLLANLYFVYGALEKALFDHRNHPVVASIYFPELNRKDSLEKDLAFYYGEDWPDQIEASRTCLAYVVRIHAIANSQPELLVSHSYALYLGNLSDGQILRNIARLALELPPGQGTALYEFEQLPAVEAKQAFKTRYWQTLDILPVNEATCQKIVEEANDAFSLNQKLMHELEADLKAGIGESIFQQLTGGRNANSTALTSHLAPVTLMASGRPFG